MAPAPSRPSTLRLAAFACGDFAFNLYWQSVMLYLLFYYTDTLLLNVETAALVYLTASVWDGIASFAVGVLADRRGSARRYRLALTVGAVPLGLAFVIAYMPPPVAGAAGVAFVLAGHLLFRTAYALVNVPYLALSARISADSGDRALVAGLRMLAGTAAAVIVALGTRPIGGWLSGAAESPRAYLGAALLFAAVATIMLLAIGATFREDVPVDARPRATVVASLRSLLANRAFVTLNAAMMAMIAAVTILNKSVLYYFKYALGDEAAGQHTLAAMMAVGAAAVPLWMLVARRTGARAIWFIAVMLCAGGLVAFASGGVAQSGAVRILLIALQAAIVGLHFSFWALLPDTIEYGQRATGVRLEATVFGLAALLQRIAIGAGTGLLGWSLGMAGFAANVAQEQTTLEAMRLTMTIAPLALLALSAWLMWCNPLARGAHDRIVRELAG